MEAIEKKKLMLCGQLQFVRQELGMRQQDVAEICEVSERTVQHWEAATIKSPNIMLEGALFRLRQKMRS